MLLLLFVLRSCIIFIIIAFLYNYDSFEFLGLMSGRLRQALHADSCWPSWGRLQSSSKQPWQRRSCHLLRGKQALALLGQLSPLPHPQLALAGQQMPLRRQAKADFPSNVAGRSTASDLGMEGSQAASFEQDAQEQQADSQGGQPLTKAWSSLVEGVAGS